MSVWWQLAIAVGAIISLGFIGLVLYQIEKEKHIT